MAAQVLDFQIDHLESTITVIVHSLGVSALWRVSEDMWNLRANTRDPVLHPPMVTPSFQ